MLSEARAHAYTHAFKANYFFSVCILFDIFRSFKMTKANYYSKPPVAGDWDCGLTNKWIMNNSKCGLMYKHHLIYAWNNN